MVYRADLITLPYLGRNRGVLHHKQTDHFMKSAISKADITFHEVSQILIRHNIVQSGLQLVVSYVIGSRHIS